MMLPAGVAALILWTMFAFEVKHLLADFILQTEFQIRDKSFYGHLGGFTHAGTHALLTVPVLLIMTQSPTMIALIAAGDIFIHYHLDWAKGYIERVAGWREKSQAYWIAFGIDQFLHQVTYLAIIAILLGRTTF